MVARGRLGSRYLAIDWGTTNRRVYLIEDGAVRHSERDGTGVTSLAKDAFPGELAAIRARFGDLPVLMAGMVGSTVGWQVAPYAPLPAGIDALSANLLWIDDRTAIVPGLSRTGDRADVMRGEEVQLLGAVQAGFVPPDSFLAQPGTHCKWVTMKGGQVVDFQTAMTGEIYALLRAHSLLAPQLTDEVRPGPAFDEGVAEARRHNLAASLFGVRASVLLGQRPATDAASYTSGILIGADVAAQVERVDAPVFHILDDSQLGVLYAAATTALGREARIVPSGEAFAAGIIAIGACLS